MRSPSSYITISFACNLPRWAVQLLRQTVKKRRRKLKRERGKEKKDVIHGVCTRGLRDLSVYREESGTNFKRARRVVWKEEKKRKEKKGERKKDAEFLGNFALNFNQTGRRFTAVHFVASSLIRFVNARPEIQQDPMYRLIRPAYEVTVIYASFNSPSLFSLVSGQRWFYSPPTAGLITRSLGWLQVSRLSRSETRFNSDLLLVLSRRSNFIIVIRIYY